MEEKPYDELNFLRLSFNQFQRWCSELQETATPAISIINDSSVYVVLIKTAFFVMLIFVFKHIRCYLKKGKKYLGKRPINQIKDLPDIVLEIHYAACYCGKDERLIQRCKSLLERYPSACNIPMNGHEYTPFLRACWNGCAELIAYMISIGANTEVATDAGEGAIYLATYSVIKKKDDDFSALKVLLATGQDINKPRYDGITAVDLAIARGHSRLALWLVTHGAVPTDQEEFSKILRSKGFK